MATQLRVFISSVMKEFQAERAAARQAVTLLRQSPVMAEDFGAKPNSSQITCLDGVRASDVCVVILGRRYGYPAPSGVSVTEEEFNEARRRGLPILVFISNEEKEPAQAEFLQRVGSYSEGYQYAKYATCEELKDQILQSLNDLHSGQTAEFSAVEAANRLQARLGFGSDRDSSLHLAVGLLPSSNIGEVVSPQRLGDPKLHEAIQKTLLFGDAPRVFDAAFGTEIEEHEKALEFRQHSNERQRSRSQFVLYSDAALTQTTSLERPGTSHARLWPAHVIDQNYLAERLGAMLKAAGKILPLLEDRRLTAFYLVVELRGIGQRMLGVVPEVMPNGLSLSMHNLGATIKVLDEPRRLSLQQLAEPEATVVDLVERLVRKFRAAGAEFTAANNAR